MPQPSPQFPLPLTRFLARLQAAGFRLDPAREWQLRQILHERGADYVGRFAELKFLLAPYLVSTATEQRRFYQFWDDWLDELEAEVMAPASAPVTDPSYLAERPWHYRWRRWLLALFLAPLLLGVVILLLEHYLWQPDVRSVDVGFELPETELWREGDTLQFRNWYEEYALEEADFLRFSWVTSDLTTGEVLDTFTGHDYQLIVPPGSGRQLRVKLIGYGEDVSSENQLYYVDERVYCGYPPVLEELNLPVRNIAPGQAVIYSVQPEENVLYEWQFGQEVLAGPQVQWTFREEGTQLVGLRAARSSDPQYCFVRIEQQASIGHDRVSFPALRMDEDPPRQFRIMKDWVFLVCLLPLLLSLPLWRQWRRRRRRTALVDKSEEQLADEFPIHDAGPYNIPYADRSGQISVPADFFRIADQLRLRESGLRRVFDGRATVEATIREGGFPAWRDRPVKRPANFLLLLEHHDEFHQQQQLLERLADFLIDREANLEVYYHNGRFDHFWNDTHPAGLNPTLLAARYRESRLLIAGKAHGLVDPYETERPRLLAGAARWLRKWNKRLLLTTEPVADWSFQEVLLHEQLPVYPMTTAGIRDGVRALNEVEDYEPGSYPRWEAAQALAYPEPGHRYRQWRTVADHRDYLSADPDLFRWLCGLAVSSTTDWNLTIATGRALGIRVTHDRLLVLSRIPWLARNAWDHDLRLALLGELSDTDLTAARTAVVEELTAVRGRVADSFAATEWTANHAVQVFCLQPGLPTNKQRIRDLRQSGWLTNDQLAELNQRVGGGAGNAGADGPAELTEWLNDEGPRPWLTGELFGALFLCLLTLFCLAAAILYEADEHPVNGPLAFFENAENIEDPARDLLNKAVEAYNQKIDIGEEEPDDTVLPDVVGDYARTLLDSALLLGDNDYPLARHNLVVVDYNELRQPLNAYAQDSLTIEQLQDLRVTEQARFLYQENSADWADWPRRLGADIGHLFGVSRLYDYQFRKRSRGFRTEEEQFASDSLDLAVLQQLYREIDSLGGGNYFDSIATVMPVNLETLLRTELRELARLKATFSSQPVGGRVGRPAREEDEDDDAATAGPGDLPLPTTYTLQLEPVTAKGVPATGTRVSLRRGSTVLREETVGTAPVRFYELDPTVRYTIGLADGNQTIDYRYDERRGALGRVVVEAAGGTLENLGLLTLSPVQLYFQPPSDYPGASRSRRTDLVQGTEAYSSYIKALRTSLESPEEDDTIEAALRQELAEWEARQQALQERLARIYSEGKPAADELLAVNKQLTELKRNIQERRDQLTVDYGTAIPNVAQQAPPPASPAERTLRDRTLQEVSSRSVKQRSLATQLQRFADTELRAGLDDFLQQLPVVRQALEAGQNVVVELTPYATATSQVERNALQQQYIQAIRQYLVSGAANLGIYVKKGQLVIRAQPVGEPAGDGKSTPLTSASADPSVAETEARWLLRTAPNHYVRVHFYSQ